jgi:chromosome partitioning protein
MRSIAVMNQKGGVGKTTTSVSLAAALADAGASVLLVDLDPQASASSWFGLQDDGRGLLRALTDEAPFAEQVRSTSLERVQIVPAGPELVRAERALAGNVGEVAILRDQVEKLPGGRWDFLLIDTPPSLGSLTSAALLAVDEVLVPVEASSMAVAGLAAMLETIRRAGRLNPKLHVTGILACRVDARTRIGREVPEVLRLRFPELLFKAQVRESVRFREAWAHRQPITLFDPRGSGAEDYRAVAAELTQRNRHGQA